MNVGDQERFALLLAIGVALAVALVLIFSGPDPELPEGAEPPVTRLPEQRKERNSGASDTADQQAAAGTTERAEDADAAKDADTENLVLTVRFAEDAAVALNNVHARVAFGREAVRNVHDRMGYDYPLRPAGWPRLLTSDSEGVLRIDLPGAVDVYLYVDDPRFYVKDATEHVPLPNDIGHEGIDMGPGWRGVSPGSVVHWRVEASREENVRLGRYREVELQFLYEDGAPASQVDIIRSGYSLEDSFHKEFEDSRADEQGRVRFPSITQEGVLFGQCLARRTGFKHSTVFSVDLDSRVHYSVVIVASDVPHQGLIINLEALDEGMAVNAHFEMARPGLPSMRGLRKGIHGTHSIMLPGREVRVFVIGDVCWKSEPIEIVESRWQEVIVPARRGARVSFRVVDAQGAPVAGAVAALHSDFTLTENWSPTSPGLFEDNGGFLCFATSGDGQVDFPAVPAGDHTLSLQMRHREFLQVRYSAQPEQHVDLGDIVLRRLDESNTMTIRVNCDPLPDSGRYRVALEGATRLRTQRKLLDANGVAEFSMLQQRQYNIWIGRYIGSGGWREVWRGPVEAGPGQRFVEVRPQWEPQEE